MKLIDNLLFANETTFIEGMWVGIVCVVIALFLLCVILPMKIENDIKRKVKDEEKDYLLRREWERTVNKAKREHPEWFD